LNNIYILDACSLIALLAGEEGAENIKDHKYRNHLYLYTALECRVL